MRRWTDEKLREVVPLANSYFEVLRLCGLKATGGGTNVLVKKRIQELGLDVSHFTGQAWRRGLRGFSGGRRIPLADILVRDSTYMNTVSLKNRLLAAGLLVEECSECGMFPTWNGKSLVLQLDHVNGIRSDNRIENLRILCPNCHSQTDTFCTRSKVQ